MTCRTCTSPGAHFCLRWLRHVVLAVLSSAALLGQPALPLLAAADLRSVSVVGEQMIELYLVDGHIIYYGLRQNWNGRDNVVFHSPLNLSAADTATSYEVSSPDDPDFAAPVRPVRVDRKSRVVDFNSLEREPHYLFGHWIYLSLPKALKSHKTYRLRLPQVAGNLPQVAWRLDPGRHLCTALHVNQVGFAPAAPKVAYLSLWAGTGGGVDYSALEGRPFTVREYASGRVRFTGQIKKRMAGSAAEMKINEQNRNLSETGVWELDFSGLTQPGEYVVSVEGLGCSHPFEISNDILREPFWYAMKGLFFQRGGIVRELEPGRVYPQGHHSRQVKWFYRPDITRVEVSGIKEQDCDKPLEGVYGFYHDAGDWDSYASHSAVPLSLLLLYSLAPDRFADGDVGNRYKLNAEDPAWINEGANGLPDILDEAGWLPHSQRRLRQALMKAGYSDGGVPSYIGQDAIDWVGHYGQGMLPSWEDRRPWIVNRVCPAATMRYAAMAAWYAHALNTWQRLRQPNAEHPQSREWVNEARAAYEWAKRQPIQEHQYAGYAALAAVCLYQVTGDAAFQEAFKAFRQQDDTRGYGQVDIWPWFFYDTVYAGLPASLPNLDQTAQRKSREAVLQAGRADAEQTLRHIGFRANLITTMHGQLGTPRFLSLAAAHALSGDSTLLEAMYHNVAYFLGGNQRNTVYVSCLGENPDKIIFHPDAWMVNDFKHKVYQWEPLPGYSTYFGALYDYVGGPGAERHVQTNAHPAYTLWPATEMRSGNRESISGNEFTVHQNNIHLAFAFGYLRAMGAGPGGFKPFPRPTVKLRLRDKPPLIPGSTVTLTAQTSPNTRRVQYYCEWRFLGESTDAAKGFPLAWTVNAPPGQTVQLTAVAYSDRGRISLPAPDAEMLVEVALTQP